VLICGEFPREAQWEWIRWRILDALIDVRQVGPAARNGKGLAGARHRLAGLGCSPKATRAPPPSELTHGTGLPGSDAQSDASSGE
jgi:hypothetical protein